MFDPRRAEAVDNGARASITNSRERCDGVIGC